MSYPSLNSTVSGRNPDTSEKKKKRIRRKVSLSGNFYHESINPKLANRKQRP